MTDGGLSPKTTDWINRAQIILWLAFAMWLLPQYGHYLFDEAYFYDQSYRVFNDPRLPVIGPFISSTNPEAFTPGGGLYLLIAPIFIFFSDPRFGTAWILILGALGTWLVDRALARRAYSTLGRLAAVTLLLWSPWHAWLSDRIWNVHLYWFLTPAMLALTIHNLGRDQISKRSGLAFGALAALILQVHIGGALAIAACLLTLFWGNPRHWRGLRLEWMTLAGLILYLPYIISDAQTGFANLQHMRGGVPAGDRNYLSVERGLRAIVLYTSHFKEGAEFRMNSGSTLYLVKLGSVPMVALALYGLTRKHVLRPLLLSLVVMAPLYFYLNRRAYHDHYVASIVPLLLLAPVLGIKAMAARHPGSRRILPALLALFAVTGIAVSAQFYMGRINVPSVGTELPRVEKLVAAGQTVAIADGHENRTQAFVWWSLAHNVLHKDLAFSLSGNPGPCTIALTPDESPGVQLIPLQGQYSFVCPKI